MRHWLASHQGRRHAIAYGTDRPDDQSVRGDSNMLVLLFFNKVVARSTGYAHHRKGVIDQYLLPTRDGAPCDLRIKPTSSGKACGFLARRG